MATPANNKPSEAGATASPAAHTGRTWAKWLDHTVSLLSGAHTAVSPAATTARAVESATDKRGPWARATDAGFVTPY